MGIKFLYQGNLVDVNQIKYNNTYIDKLKYNNFEWDFFKTGKFKFNNKSFVRGTGGYREIRLIGGHVNVPYIQYGSDYRSFITHSDTNSYPLIFFRTYDGNYGIQFNINEDERITSIKEYDGHFYTVYDGLNFTTHYDWITSDYSVDIFIHLTNNLSTLDYDEIFKIINSDVERAG